MLIAQEEAGIPIRTQHVSPASVQLGLLICGTSPLAFCRSAF